MPIIFPSFTIIPFLCRKSTNSVAFSPNLNIIKDAYDLIYSILSSLKVASYIWSASLFLILTCSTYSFSFITLTAKLCAYEFKSKGPITNLNSSIMLGLAIPYPTLTPANP